MARCFVSFAARGVALDAFGSVCMAEGLHSIRLSLRNILLLGVLMLAAASTGIISIGSAFMADDLTLVRAGKHMMQEDFLRPFYRPWIWDEIVEGWPVTSLYYYRPITVATFAWDYFWFGLNPTGYHLTKVLLHIAATILVYMLALRLFSKLAQEPPRWPPFIGALLFALHPGHKFAVLWISARSDALCAVFFLATLLLFLRWLEKPRPWHSPAIFATTLLALGLKEMAFSLPLVCGCLMLVFKPLRLRERPWWREAMVYLAPTITAASIVIIMRLMLIAPDHPALDFATSPAQKTYTLYLSLRHLVLPFTVGLREWVITHPIITATIVGIAVWFSLLSLQHLRQRLVWLSLAWIALTLLPVMNVFKPWYLYIPSIGFCFLLAWALTRPQGYR